MIPARSEFINKARERVSKRFGVVLARIPPLWWEEPPHDTDPQWPFLMQYALDTLFCGILQPEDLTRHSRFRVVMCATQLLKELALDV